MDGGDIADERTCKYIIVVQEFWRARSLFQRECAIVERLEIPLGGPLLETAGQGLTTGPLTEG